MKRWWILAIALLAGLSQPIAGQTSRPELRFRADGTFRIVQLTDLHLAQDHWSNFMVWDNLQNILETQDPDLLVLTGDLIYSAPAGRIFGELLDSLDRTGLPYALIFGNHDRQFDLDGEALLALARQRPRCLTGDVPELSGEGTYLLPVLDGDKTKAALWFFDSGDTSPFSRKEIPEYDYDYVRSDRIAWYGQTSATLAQEAGAPVPGYAFLHIPFPEYKEIKEYTGTWREPVCCPHVNSGLFCKMLERGDVRAVFCGHDHDNDWCGSLYGITLAYGRYSGGKAEYNNLEPNGARVIVLEDFGRRFSTWLSLSDGTELYR